jgi:hypothetical protein
MNDPSLEPGIPDHWWKNGLLPWMILGICFAAQLCLFLAYLHREILWGYPIMWDQTRYLQESHDALRAMLTEGFLRGLTQALTSTTSNGNLLPAEAGVAYLFFGDSRLTALSILFFHWILFQAAAVYTIRWLSNRWSVVVISFALLLLAASPFREIGGLADFRIDFAACCAFGVFLCLAIRSNFFANRGWGALAGLAASYLILLRFITLVYLGVICAMFFLVVGALRLFRRQPAAVRDRDRMRLTNLLVVGGLITVICLPVFWRDRNAIQKYYVVLHVTGIEKYIRAQESGVNNRLDSVLYYPRSVWEQQAGPLFCETAAGLILASLLLAGLRRKYATVASSAPVSDRLDAVMAYAFLTCCLLGPYLVLTADVSKSPVVGNIFVPPLWAMVALGVVYAAGTTDLAVRWSRAAVRGLALLLLGFAACYQISSYGRQGSLTARRTQVERVLELQDLVGEKCAEFGLPTPAIGMDRNRDTFYPGVLAVTQWERHRISIAPRNAYPMGIFAVSEAEVMDGLQSADFVLLTLSPAVENSAYPFENSMQAMQSKLAEFCDQEMVPLQETSFFGQHVRLYMRPMVVTEIPNNDWITEEGLTLRGTPEVLRRFPRITLRGSTFPGFHFPNDDRNVTATLETKDRPSSPVPATLTETNGQYTLQFVVPSPEIGSDNPLTIHVRFRRYFVPRDIGLNGDLRHLVIRLPDSVHLDRPTVN